MATLALDLHAYMTRGENTLILIPGKAAGTVVGRRNNTTIFMLFYASRGQHLAGTGAVGRSAPANSPFAPPGDEDRYDDARL